MATLAELEAIAEESNTQVSRLADLEAIVAETEGIETPTFDLIQT